MNMVRNILESPCASDWLKQAVIAAGRRDILDALRDAETLAEALRQKWNMLHSEGR